MCAQPTGQVNGRCPCTAALAGRVYDALASNDDAWNTVIDDGADRYPATPADTYLTSFERACRRWGVHFGIAYGIARGEDPYECVESVVARALEAATEAWRRYNADDEAADILTEAAYLKSRAGERPKSMADALKPVMDAYERAYTAQAAIPACLATELLKLDAASH